jgi:hypothetical protein
MNFSVEFIVKIKQGVIPFLPLSMFILSKFGTKSVLESGCRISLVKILQKYGTTHRHGLVYSLETRWHMKIMTTAGRRVGPVNQSSARASCYFNQLTNSQIQGWAESSAISIGPTALCTKHCGTSIYLLNTGSMDYWGLVRRSCTDGQNRTTFSKARGKDTCSTCVP